MLEERVASGCARRRGPRDQVLDHLAHPVLAIHPRRNGVQAEQGDHHVARRPTARLDAEPHQPQLVLQRQSVPRLHLDGGDAAPREPRQPLPGRAEQGAVARGARRRDRVADPAALFGDLQIRHSREPLRMLSRPIAGEDQVRVRVDEAGREQRSGAVHRLARRRSIRGADIDDLLAVAGHRAVLDHRQRRLAGARLRAGHRRHPCVAQDQHQRVRPGIFTPRSRATWIASS